MLRRSSKFPHIQYYQLYYVALLARFRYSVTMSASARRRKPWKDNFKYFCLSGQISIGVFSALALILVP